MIAIIRKILARLESGKTTDHTVSLDGRDMTILASYDPLAPLHRDCLIAPVVNRDVVDKRMRLIGGSRKLGGMNDPVDRGLETREELRLH